jgi:hypothetical protein
MIAHGINSQNQFIHHKVPKKSGKEALVRIFKQDSSLSTFTVRPPTTGEVRDISLSTLIKHLHIICMCIMRPIA